MPTMVNGNKFEFRDRMYPTIVQKLEMLKWNSYQLIPIYFHPDSIVKVEKLLVRQF